MVLDLSIFNLLNCLPLIINKSKNIKEIFELILLLAFINFLNKRSIKKILFLTGNSRTSDALLIASSVLKIETREYLHGIPSKFIYERANILNKNNPNNKAIRLIPINDYCIFSKNNNSEFFNHNFDNLIINTKRISEKNYKKLVFGGCTSHHKNYLDSGVYKLEIIILEYLVIN